MHIKKSKKNLDKGQHFLIDQAIIKKGIDIANISKKDKILEIGAGDGNLTKELVKKAGEVLAFEIDKQYTKKLDILKKKNKNLRIVYDDVLNYSWKNYTKIISNIPHFISEQVIKKSIKEEIPEMVLFVGEKFKKILQKKQSKMGIIANLFYRIKFIIKVNKKCFSPPSRVDSWLIKFEKRKKFSDKELILVSILNRKGKLKNAILYSLVKGGKTKRESEEIIKKMDIYENSLEKPVSKITGKLLIRLINELGKLKQ